MALVIQSSLTLSLLGLLLGVAAVWLAGRAISDLLFETGILDPLTLLLVSALILLTSLLAAFLPARRATAIDPVKALKASELSGFSSV